MRPSKESRETMKKKGFTWVKPHLRNGRLVIGYWRRVPKWYYGRLTPERLS